jgi:hypothetical protein
MICRHPLVFESCLIPFEQSGHALSCSMLSGDEYNAAAPLQLDVVDATQGPTFANTDTTVSAKTLQPALDSITC